MRYYHPIFVTVCRLISIFFALLKLWCNYTDVMRQIYADDERKVISKEVNNQGGKKKGKMSTQEIIKLRMYFKIMERQKDNFNKLLAIEKSQ